MQSHPPFLALRTCSDHLHIIYSKSNPGMSVGIFPLTREDFVTSWLLFLLLLLIIIIIIIIIKWFWL